MAINDLKETFRPTLLIGVGGTGIKIAERIFTRAVAERSWLRDRLDVVAIDTDENDLRGLSVLENRQWIQVSTADRVAQLLDKNPEFEGDWFGPRRKLPHEILNMTLIDGAAQIRLLTRLALTHALKRRAIQQPLGDAVSRIAALNSRTVFGGALNVMLVGSLAGATGSGLFLPIALLIASLCRERSIAAEVRGLFLLPDVFVRSGTMLAGQIDNVHANAYAALKELNAINLFAGERGGAGDLRYEYAPGARVSRAEFPFTSVSLIDYENVRGGNLGRNLDNYLEMASRAIYVLLFTPIGQKVASVSVNDARAVSRAASQDTTNIYSGVGVSTIEYPANEIADYLTLKLANENLAGDWLRLDRSFFERQRRYEEQRAAGNLAARRPDQGQAFLEDLDQFAKKDRLPFFAEIDARLHPVVRDEKTYAETVEARYETYLDAILGEVIARFWARENLRPVRGRTMIDSSQLRSQVAMTDMVRRLETTLDEDLRAIDAALPVAPEDDFVNILLTADDLGEGEWRPFHLQSYLIKDGPHLIEVRAFLYALARRTAERRAKLDPRQKRRLLYTQSNVFDTDRAGDPTDRRSPKTIETAREVAERGLLSRWVRGSPDDFRESYAAYFNTSVQALRAFAEEEIRSKVLDLLADEVAGLERHYAGLFLELRAIFERLTQDADLLEGRHSAEARATNGNVFVNADREAKAAVWAELRTASGGLHLEEAANKTLGRDVYRRYRADKRQRVSTDFVALGGVFKNAIVDGFARSTVRRDFRSHYDIGIVEAVKRESQRNREDWKARLRALVGLVSSQSDPFLTLVDQGHGQRSMYWAVHPDVRRDIADDREFETLFTFNQGEQPLLADAFSPKHLMCFNSKVLLELVHLTKIQAGDRAGHTINAAAPGHYFGAYARMIDGLIEEDLDARAKSPHITPHLDAGWHRPGALPEISPDLARALRNDTYRALAIALGVGLISFGTHYGQRLAAFSTLGRVAASGVATDLVASHDWWDVTGAFLARSELVRATDRFWKETLHRLETGETLEHQPMQALADPAFVAAILRLSVPRDDEMRREERTRALLTGWISAASDVIDVTSRELAAPGRRARRDQAVKATRTGAFDLLRQDGVRQETLSSIERVFDRAVEEARAVVGTGE